MVGVERDNAVDRRRELIDVESLSIAVVVVGDRNDAAVLHHFFAEAACHGVGELALVDAVPFLCNVAGNALRKPSQTVRQELRFTLTVKNWNHTVHHLGVTMTFVIPVPSVMVFEPGARTGKSLLENETY